MAPTTTTALAALASASSSSSIQTQVGPPVSPYGTFHGALFQYERNLVAFESSPPSLNPPNPPSPHKCILLGGLSDGLIPTPYTQLLEKTCHTLGWSLVQPIFSSSYLGFGNGSLERDTEEISSLLNYLTIHRAGRTYALVGHSTGCQNSIHFLRYGQEDMIDRLKFVALQAPVSDREDAAYNIDQNQTNQDGTKIPTYKENVETAERMVANGEGEEMMPRASFWAPIKASRFLDLQGRGGADDYFSSDLGDRELVERLKHVGRVGNRTGLRLLAAYSGRDEYVPQHVDKKELVERLCQAMNEKCWDRQVATAMYLGGANHNLSQGEGDKEIFVEKVGEFLEVVMGSEEGDEGGGR